MQLYRTSSRGYLRGRPRSCLKIMVPSASSRRIEIGSAWAASSLPAPSPNPARSSISVHICFGEVAPTVAVAAAAAWSPFVGGDLLARRGRAAVIVGASSAIRAGTALSVRHERVAELAVTAGAP